MKNFRPHITVVKSILGLTQEFSSEVETLVSWTNEVALGHYDIEINEGLEVEVKKRTEIGIDCKEEKDRNHIVITYWDNGRGIERDEREKVYDPFYTTAEGTGGTGLGMNIVYNLVNGLLLGCIDYIDDSSYGVCFQISLPKTA